jgi:hypothetical protein
MEAERERAKKEYQRLDKVRTQCTDRQTDRQTESLCARARERLHARAYMQGVWWRQLFQDVDAEWKKAQDDARKAKVRPPPSLSTLH